MRKVVVLLLAFLFLLGCVGCGGGEAENHGDPNANREVPADSITLNINQESNGRELVNFGVQLDSYFLVEGYNVGRNGVKDGRSWEVKASDWEDVVVPRMKEMGLSRIRTQVMPGWYAPTEDCYKNKTYEWETPRMQALFKLLDTAKELNIEVNLTIWGTDGGARWLLEEDSEATTWLDMVADDRWEDFAGVSADLIKALVVDFGYTNIAEVTLYNEPTQDFSRLGLLKGFSNYAEICKLFDQKLREVGVRDKIKLVLSDDTSSSTWLSNTLYELEGVYDMVSSHSYCYGVEHSNDMIQNTMNTYALRYFRDAMEGYESVPHVWNEFGLGGPTYQGQDTHTVPYADSPMRGLEIARVALNLIYSGSWGANYWLLFNSYYDTSERIMNMGLWRYADDAYACNPVFYAYSLFTRFCEKGSRIYPMEMADDNLIGVAFRTEDDRWTYMVVNNSDEEKKVSFLNNTLFPANMQRYTYDTAAVPSDNEVLKSDGSVTANGRVLTDTLKPQSFIVYTDIAEE